MNYDNIVRWLTLGVTVAFIVLLVLAVINGLRRGIFRSTVRTVTIVLAIPVAILLLNLIKRTALFEKLSSFVDVSQLGIEDDVMAGNAEVLAKAIISPLAFAIIFYLVSKVFYFIYLVIKLVFGKKIGGGIIGKGVSRSVGALISLLGALVTFFGVFCPVNGYIGCLAEAKNHVENNAENERIIEVCDSAKETRSHFIFSLCDKLSDNIFSSLTKIEYKSLGGEKTYKSSLSSEVFGTLEILPEIKNLASMAESQEIDYVLLKSSIKGIDEYDGENDIYTAKIIVCYVTRRIGEEAPSYFDGYDPKYLTAVSPLFGEMKACNEENASQKLLCAINVFSALDKMQAYLDLLNAKTATGDGAAVEEIVKYIDTDGWENYTKKMIRNCVEDNTNENVEAFSEIAISILDNLYKIKESGGNLSEECEKADKTFIATYNCIKHKNSLTVAEAQEMIESVIGSTAISTALGEVKDKNVTLDNLQPSDVEKIKETLLAEKTTENEDVISAIASIFDIELT